MSSAPASVRKSPEWERSRPSDFANNENQKRTLNATEQWEQEQKALAYDRLPQTRKKLGLSSEQQWILRAVILRASTVNRPISIPQALARPDGWLFWQSVGTTHKETEYSERTIQRAFKRFTQLHVLEPIGSSAGGSGRACVYRLNMQAIQKGDTVSPFPQPMGDSDGSERVTDRPEKGDNGDSAIRKDNIIENTKGKHQQQAAGRTGDIGSKSLVAVDVDDSPVDLQTEKPSATPNANLEALDSEIMDPAREMLPVVTTGSDEWHRLFDGYQSLGVFDGKITGSGRERIKRASKKKSGFTPAQFAYAVEQTEYWSWGGVIECLAENWHEETSHITRWPRCLLCQETGHPLLPVRKVRRKVDRETRREKASDYLTAYCRRVSNDPKIRREQSLEDALTAISLQARVDASTTLGLGYCDCEFGRLCQAREDQDKEAERQKAAAVANELAAEEARRMEKRRWVGVHDEEVNTDSAEAFVAERDHRAATHRAAAAQAEIEKQKRESADQARCERETKLKAQNICPECDNDSKETSQCNFCRGTGKYFSWQECKAQDICCGCYGTKIPEKWTKKGHPCLVCKGSGRYVPGSIKEQIELASAARVL